MGSGARPERREGGEGDRAAATRARIIDAGTELFAERGFAASSMRELAERAGVSLSASYYHFAGKQDVLLAIMGGAMARLEHAANEVMKLELTPLERIAALVRAHVREHLFEPDAARVADGELRALGADAREAMVDRRDSYELIFSQTLRDGVECGDFRDSLDVRVAAMAMITMGTSTAIWWRPDGRLSVDQTAAQMADLAVAMATADVVRRVRGRRASAGARAG